MITVKAMRWRKGHAHSFFSKRVNMMYAELMKYRKMFRPFWVRCGLLVVAGLLAQCGNKQAGPGNEGPEKPDVEITPDPGKDLYGILLDGDQKPVKGVVVSDGYTAVVTDDRGIYQLTRNKNARFVFYSTPADYEITVESPSRNIPA